MPSSTIESADKIVANGCLSWVLGEGTDHKEAQRSFENILHLVYRFTVVVT